MYVNIPLQLPSKGISVESKGRREYLTKNLREIAYDHPQTRQIYLLIFHQCINADHRDHHLLCHMKCRMNGVEINETPKFLLNNPNESSHAIVVEDTEGSTLLVIPLLINGFTSYFTCRNPARSEYEDGDLPRIDLSAEIPDWYSSDRDYD